MSQMTRPPAPIPAGITSQKGPEDSRVRAFCSPDGPEIFHPVAHRHEIWREDPFDVETIHEEARAAYQRLLNRATTPPGLPSGRILLLLGEAGSGKTHLMRAFRNWTHSKGLGYCGYMQMTSATDHYGRYVLNNVIESLDQPYYEPEAKTSGLMRLSTALAERPDPASQALLRCLREGDLDDDALARVVDDLADRIVIEDRFDRVDIDLVRALLYLQRDNPRIKGRVLEVSSVRGPLGFRSAGARRDRAPDLRRRPAVGRPAAWGGHVGR